MKKQTEIISYVTFSLLIIAVMVFTIYYYWFFSRHITLHINKINLHFFTSVLEFPIISINSVCFYCIASYYVNLIHLNTTFQSTFLVYYDENENKIKYTETYSNEFLSSSLLNILYLYYIDAFANSRNVIFFEFNSFEKTIKVRNI